METFLLEDKTHNLQQTSKIKHIEALTVHFVSVIMLFRRSRNVCIKGEFQHF